ncbi:MAG: thiol peroxidase [Caldilineaceae bacterium]|nr:thiol peroxidase [Caldilineaceae bacterium]
MIFPSFVSSRKVTSLTIISTATASVLLGQERLDVLGERVEAGQPAPEVELADGWITATSLLASTAGKVRLISVIPCIQTRVCDMQTRRMNEEASALGEQVAVITVSADPPPVQGVWCGATGVDRVKMLSDHQKMAFGVAYGVYIPAMRALQRAMFVVDQNNVVRYTEYVPEIGLQPNYDAALNVVRALIST